jgi:hypothetical protein
MEYSIKQHGDWLEREAEEFIQQWFPHYEAVWKCYIGNDGFERMGRIPNYPDENKRMNFAENSYTALESAFLIHDIIKSGIFLEPPSNFRQYLELNKAFITVFALLGRLHDTVIKVSECLNYDNSGFRQSLKKFYEARSIVIHGKKIPLQIDESGFLIIPYLQTHVIEGKAWNDKTSHWNETEEMNSQFLEDKLSNFLYQIISIVNDEYAKFHHVILEELKSIPTGLIFEHTSKENIKDKSLVNYPSASGRIPANIYNLSNSIKRVE